MTDEEVSYRSIKLEQISQFCRSKQIKYLRIPLKDFFEDEYCFDLFVASKELKRVISPNNAVYLHCSSGVTRAPTLAIIFLCLFKLIEPWRHLEASFRYLQNFNKEIAPNLKVVQRVLDQNSSFQ